MHQERCSQHAKPCLKLFNKYCWTLLKNQPEDPKYFLPKIARGIFKCSKPPRVSYNLPDASITTIENLSTCDRGLYRCSKFFKIFVQIARRFQNYCGNARSLKRLFKKYTLKNLTTLLIAANPQLNFNANNIVLLKFLSQKFVVIISILLVCISLWLSAKRKTQASRSRS